MLSDILGNTLNFNKRPPTFDKLQWVVVIEIVTHNASQWRKSYAQLEKELYFKISQFTVSQVLPDSGYSQHISHTKPFFSEKNMVLHKMLLVMS